MALIELENITKRFGSVVAVDHLNINVESGEFLTLLGPSGCGKTTVLRMIAGLEIPDEGEIRIKGKRVFSSKQGSFVPPGKRGVGLVFQSYALWPHMNVFQNVAFGLQIQKITQEEMKNKVMTALNYMHLKEMEKRYPQELSGGQQQRVALARMLVVSPSIFLMDEPLSNLDAKLRMDMRTEIKRIHRESKATTVYVTHDQTEALTLSSKVAVMDKGVLQQVDSPHNIYKRPANLFVADFIGSPTINFIHGKIISKEGEIFFEAETFSFVVPFMKDFCGEPVIAAIRPEEIQVSRIEDQEAISGEVYSVLPAGAEVILQVKRRNITFNIQLMGEPSFEVGEAVYLQLPKNLIIFYHHQTGALLYPQQGL
jgi:multiple sugar transport system ATP-binding protein